MKVFLSWSGKKSQAAAQLLHEWIPNVLHSARTYLSVEDIEKGARWQTEIARELQEASFGIVCVTVENVGSSWLNFEAGALSKSIDNSRVIPLLLDLSPAELQGPLLQFQAMRPTCDEFKRMIQGINGCGEGGIPAPRVDASVERWWADLETGLKSLDSVEAGVPTKITRSTDELMEEVLTMTRQIERRQAHLEWALLRGSNLKKFPSNALDAAEYARRLRIAGVEVRMVDKAGEYQIILPDDPPPEILKDVDALTRVTDGRVVVLTRGAGIEEVATVSEEPVNAQ